MIRAKYSAVLSNWILFRRKLVTAGLVDGRNVTLDLSPAKLVDHSVMEKPHELQQEFDHAGVRLDIVGLDSHVPLSRHQYSARKLAKSPT